MSVFYINNDKPIRVGRIKAHSNEVNSIQYAYLSNRFISGSKDGTGNNSILLFIIFKWKFYFEFVYS